MKYWIITIIVIIFAIGTITTVYLYLQQRSDISNAQSQISALKTDISVLKTNAAALPGQVTAVTPAAQSSTNSVIDLVPKYEPTVVRVDVTGPGFQGAGSGFIVDSGGYVLTNQHVIDNATSINVTLKSGQQSSATVVSGDKTQDLALLKLSANLTNLPTVVMGSSSDIIVGEDVVAIGFPLGKDLPGPASFAQGIVSAIRNMDGINYVQTDVPVSPGNSGGCLVTLNGKVIGVVTATIAPSNLDAEDIGLAIPIDLVQSYIQNNLKK